MPTTSSLWAILEERTGQPLPHQARRLLECLGAVARWQKITSQKDRDELLRAALRLIAALRESGLLRADSLPVEVEPPLGRSDGRWELWRRLRSRTTAGTDGQWSPFTVTRVYDFTTHPAVGAQRVEVSFDARLSLRSVVGTLRRLWPRLHQAQWLRQSHPLGARKLALVEFVCLEMEPDTGWREMLAAWNAGHPQWPYRSVRAFQGEFRRAEQSLTGERFGLEWFYCLQARPESHGSLTAKQVMAMLAVGAKDEDRRFAARLFAPVIASAQEVTLGMAPRIRWAQDLAAAGLSAEEIADELLEQLPEQLPVILESGEEEDPRETARGIARALLELDVPEPGPGDLRIDYPGVRRL